MQSTSCPWLAYLLWSLSVQPLTNLQTSGTAWALHWQRTLMGCPRPGCEQLATSQTAVTWIIGVYPVPRILQHVHLVPQLLDAVSHSTLPTEAAALCPHKVNCQALRWGFQQAPQAAALIAVVQFCYAIQVKCPAQAVGAWCRPQVGGHPASNWHGEACTQDSNRHKTLATYLNHAGYILAIHSLQQVGLVHQHRVRKV